MMDRILLRLYRVWAKLKACRSITSTMSSKSILDDSHDIVGKVTGDINKRYSYYTTQESLSVRIRKNVAM